MEIIIVVLLVLVACGVISFMSAAAFVGKIMIWSVIIGIIVIAFAAIAHSGE